MKEHQSYEWYTYRITADLKVETDIIISIVESPIGRDVIICVKILKAEVIVYIGNAIICLTSRWPIIFSIRVSLLILTISLGEIKGQMIKLQICMNNSGSLKITYSVKDTATDFDLTMMMKGPWWLYGSRINNYLSNQCLSPLK